MEKYINLLRSQGYKMTLQRRSVIAALISCSPFASAQTVWDHVRRTAPDVSLDTVYRNLNLLVELGMVQEIHTRTREGSVYELVTADHHHHLVCLECGKAQCLDFCPISGADIARAEEIGSGFTVVSHSLEFYGYCQSCR